MGVSVEQIVDLKALMGDASDNIPGVAGIGPKTAITLLKQFGSLENLYLSLDADTAEISKSVRQKLEQNRELAFLSQELATIKRDVDLSLNLNECEVRSYDKEKVVGYFEELGFKSLVRLLPNDQFEDSLQESLF